MIIKKMTANFGCLEKESIELHEGLNVITAPNESGKSTWCAFIRAMLYGVDSSQREKNGVKPDKVKYAPWSGTPMSGEMDIEHDGQSITLSRSTRTTNAPMREFSAVYSGTGQTVPGLKGADAGQNLTGMSKAVFESSVFVSQSKLTVENNAELEKRIAAIVSTGDEGASYTQADGQLRAWQRKRRHNRSGAIPTLEAEISALEKRLDEQHESVKERDSLERRLEKNSEWERLAQRQAEEETKRQRQQLLESVEEARGRLELAQKRGAEKKEKALLLKAELDSGIFAGKSPQEATDETEKDIEELEQEKKRVPKGILYYLPTVFAILLMAVGVLIDEYVDAVSEFAGFIIMLFILQIIFSYYKARAKKAEEAIKRKYSVENISDVDKLLARHEKKLDEYERINEQLRNAQYDEENSRLELSRREKALLESAGSAAESSLERVRAESAYIRQQLSHVQGRFSALGDPMVLETELKSLRERKAELQSEYDAIALAVETLSAANDEMQIRFSPELSRLASSYMERLSLGRYDRLLFDRELSVRAKLTGDISDHEKSFLSVGTADQIYLALRLAICKLALGENGSCPLILDDALVNFDDERMAAALELLREIAKTRQVILFSCHDREERYLREMKQS